MVSLSHSVQLLHLSHIFTDHAGHDGPAVAGIAVPLPPAHGGVVEYLSHHVHLLLLFHVVADHAGYALAVVLAGPSWG